MSASLDNTFDETTPAAIRRRNWRMFVDRSFGRIMAVGGVGVIVAILMIFFYLFYVVIPLFASASIEPESAFQAPTKGTDVAYLSLDEYAEIGLIVTRAGNYEFFDAASGKAIERGSIAHSDQNEVVAVTNGDRAAGGAIFVAYDDGAVVVTKPEYAISYPDDSRQITPSLRYPLGVSPISLGHDNSPVRLFNGQLNDEEATIASVDANGNINLTSVAIEESLLGDEVEVEVDHHPIPQLDYRPAHILLDVDQRELYIAAANGQTSYFDIQNKSNAKLVDVVNLASQESTLNSLEFLSGGISIIAGDSNGTISQWFPVRDDNNNYSLERVREFEPLDSGVATITPEYFRKGFLAADDSGGIAIFHTTAERTVLRESPFEEVPRVVAISPRADAVLTIADNGYAQKFALHNEHPEVSWQAIWGEVWYESRQSPEYIWQSSSASSDFEPKFSLTPLTFGTIKASIYAMAFAIPLAIFGALYTAYFMTPKMRSFVKPSVEVMAALPTVILGFLAGLWLAPLVERYLSGVFLSFVLIPASFVVCSWVYVNLPKRWRTRVPDGWEGALLVPVVIFAIWLSLALSQPLEALFFDGSLSLWLTTEMGIPYDQRNSLVVGMAIGFAVIPTIFSISEDAIFGVPRHLTTGSLALGATPWQTVVGVVLLTASPGIFSAVMIGLGRAVGETMIVLMATGNTPIMDFNIFQGFRALSANIAVEMPESEVGSTHYRVLFLAALVLFLVTFAVNTIAEIVRQRLRERYSNL